MSGRFPEPTRKNHQAFCLIEEWTEVRNARRRTGHHCTYELPLPDGRILRTRISHPPNRQVYGKSLWSHVLRDQLEVTEPVFWACVRDKARPARGAVVPDEAAIPAAVVSQLLANGVSEIEVRGLSKMDAIHRLTEIWSAL
ncbi:cytotoxic translational repressor of toxin-antitoxin stability system [Amycolatopsis panacis]|uniref:Cytotoxic translational repressor of toxin-antitoxin stability system n=1 Tax=Amycolatopsis panacis TaxID=2340917 RepID=A0A419IAS7_9PSEU|nr:cytotoxic translational repressor of toxin-antitoxin stability system [Amycolatopsis panacis]RJQ91212.1 cytotoxic translational repressor of toxin-antitoxin stability system [Amycolatopsis panacis]